MDGCTRHVVRRDIVRYFKYELLTEDEKKENKYTYQVLGFAQHAETGEKMVVYQQLYVPFGIYVQSLRTFMSEVDHDKYPEIKQKYRFERV